MTEHWLSSENKEYLNNSGLSYVSGYFREQGERGGSSILVSDQLIDKVKAVFDYDKFALKYIFEFNVIELCLYNSIFIIVCIYRVPEKNNFELFCTQLELLLHSLFDNRNNVKKQIILGGDLNVNTLISDKYSKKLTDIVTAYGLQFNYNVPTRITNNTKTCIDHIISNCSVESSHILQPGLSDHTAQLVEISITDNPVSKRTCIRSFKESNIINFCRDLTNEEWKAMYDLKYDNNDSNFVNSLYKQFLHTFMIHFESNFPKKHVTINPKQTKKRWLTDEIISLSTRKRDLFTLMKHNSGDKLVEIEYRECKRILKTEIKKAKLNYYNEIIKSAKNISKASWAVAKQELGKSSTKTAKDFELEVGDNNIRHAKAANLLNNHFLTVTDKLNLKPNINSALIFSKNYCSNVSDSLFFNPVVPLEISLAIKKLKHKKSSGWDDIPMFLVKRLDEVLAPHLASIFNQCLTLGVFPDLLKYSIIRPIKKNKGKSVDDFRPISLLSVFSNLLERIILNRLLPFLDKHNIINREQYGFRQNLSTVDAVSEFTDLIIKNTEQKFLSAAIFCDLSKAFEAMDRNILLLKMENYGIRGPAIKMFQSYFEERFQKVSINNQGNNFDSQWKLNKTGCPQGSILGPILFLIYVADLPKNSNTKFSNTIQYADDTTVVVQDGIQRDLDYNIEECIQNLSTWFSVNGLRLNDNKTQIIKFKSRKTKSDNIQGESISGKFLGITIDSKLNFTSHTETLSKTLNSSCFALKVLSNTVNKNVLRMVYCATVQSRLTYGLIIWGSTSLENFNRIFRIQKRAIRIIHHVKVDQPCQKLFCDSKLMTLPCLYVYELCKYFLKHRDQFSECINTLHNYKTRHNFIAYPAHSTSQFEKSPNYMARRVINKFMQLNRGDIVYNNCFLKRVKSYLCNHAFYCLNDFFSSNSKLNELNM